MKKIPITSIGFQKLQEELKRLKTVDRLAIAEEIAQARSSGDITENPEYLYARERQAFIEKRIADLEDKILHLDVIDIYKLSGDTIKFGAAVTLVDREVEEEFTYLLVGSDECNIEEGLLSISSPLGHALIGKKKGDNIEFFAPAGKRFYEVRDVTFIQTQPLENSYWPRKKAS